jgi:ATP-binding protein involved in chromosome partitioning
VVDEIAVREALRTVNDPHIPIGIDRLAMLRGVHIDDTGAVVVELGVPCLGCPGVSMLKQAVTDAVVAVPGVTTVTVDEGWHHEWTGDMVDSEARDQMRRYGIVV